MKTRAALFGVTTATLLILLLGSNVAVAAESQSITLAYFGGIDNIGSQRYRSSGGSLVSAAGTLAGKTLSLPSAHLDYSIEAEVKGNTVTGHASLQLRGPDATSGEDEDAKSGQVWLTGRFQLISIVPAVGFPLDPAKPDNPLACLALATGCTSEIPGFFLGVGELKLKNGDSRISLPNTPMLFESAYLNPFGAPIFIGTPDGSLSIAVKYSSAISHWANVKTSGIVQTGAGTNDNGAFTIVSDLTENLLKGTETDRGKITLSGFVSTPALNSAGEFQGRSVIPPALPDSDCTPFVNAQLNTIPGFSVVLPPNTCTTTGAISTGGIELKSVHGENEFKGTYIDNWFAPAVGFLGQATVTIEED